MLLSVQPPGGAEDWMEDRGNVDLPRSGCSGKFGKLLRSDPGPLVGVGGAG